MARYHIKTSVFRFLLTRPADDSSNIEEKGFKLIDGIVPQEMCIRISTKDMIISFSVSEERIYQATMDKTIPIEDYAYLLIGIEGSLTIMNVRMSYDDPEPYSLL